MTSPVTGMTHSTIGGTDLRSRDLMRGQFGTASASALEWHRLASGEMAIPVGVMLILLAMVTPLPPLALDLLITANITLSTVILLVSMYIRKPADFNVFPTTLLLMTLFRLALNVSSSRLILLNGATGTHAAGEVIESFGNFVVGGNYIIGMVIFLVLIAIQYVVINHGAVRISEVTARFTLDALPGKQMSIDADLNAGLINESEARQRRRDLAGEAEFYGAMDGATRFTQRDAIASILITAINIVAGFLIGVLQHDLELVDALETYTVLTIGDGLVTVIPALMISISGGLIVTRASSERGLAAEMQSQVFGLYQPLMMTAAALTVMAVLPGMPKVPFLLMGGGVGYAAYRMRVRQKAELSRPSQAVAPAAKDHLEALLRLEPLALEVGLGLVKLVEGGAESPLLRRVSAIRRQLAAELGYILPPVRVTDNLTLRPRQYAVLLKGAEVARYELPPGCELAIPPTGGKPPAGVPTVEPAFGIRAVWVASEASESARQAGCTVVDPLSVLSAHLTELIRRHAHEVFSRQDAKRVLDRVAEEHPRVVEDLVPKLLPLATVQRVFQNLLRERVSIRDAATILECLGEAAVVTRNPMLLTEYVRQQLRRTIVLPHLSGDTQLSAFFLDPPLETAIERAAEHGEHSSHLNLSPPRIKELLDGANAAFGGVSAPFVLIAASSSRCFVRQLLETHYPQITVLSHGEVPPGIQVVNLGTVRGTAS